MLFQVPKWKPHPLSLIVALLIVNFSKAEITNASSVINVQDAGILEEKTKDSVKLLLKNRKEDGEKISSELVELVFIGMPSLKYGGLKLLISETEQDRKDGEFLLSAIIARQFGYIPGYDFVDEDQRSKFESLWNELGQFSSNLDEDARLKSYQLWSEWIDQNYVSAYEEFIRRKKAFYQTYGKSTHESEMKGVLKSQRR